MRITGEPLDLPLRHPFRISRGVQERARSVQVSIEVDGVTGIGEAAPDSSGYYGEKIETILAALPYLEHSLPADPLLREDALQRMDATLHHGHGALKAAIDMALWDYAGQRAGQPVYRLLGLDPLRAPLTSLTIGIASPQDMAQRAREAHDFPILKIKVGSDQDVERVRAIRDVTDAVLRVDANAAWTAKEALRSIEQLAPFGVEFVEQPVAAEDLAGLAFVRDRSPLPIIADESCVTLADLPRIAACCDGINIKLAKCGGITNALKLIAAARAHGLKVMLGCMVSSSLAITAAAQLSPLVDYADLDGALLIADDPFAGVRVDRGRLILPDEPGLGVHLAKGTGAA
jgi:L-alanine-DL-glutamate epimerase-like enolase superfamily enzyme